MRTIPSLVFASLLLCTSPFAVAQAQQGDPAKSAEVQERVSYEADEEDASGMASADESVTDAGAPAAPALVAVQAAEERPICRQEKPSGSNRPVRVCRTKAQMQADRDASRARMERGTYNR